MKKLLIFLLTMSLAFGLTCLPAWASGEASRQNSGEASQETSGEASFSWEDFFASLFPEIDGPYDIEETDVETVSGGVTLRGILTVPVIEESEKLPFAVLTHGFNTDNSDMAQIAEALGKNGIASVRFNLAANGNSDGDWVDVTFTSQKNDVLAALDFAKKLEFVDTNNLFLIGKSQGGFDSALASLDCEDEINALILWFPAICIPDDFNSGRLQFVEFDPVDIPDTVDFMGLFQVSREFIEEGMAIDPLTDLTGFGKDVLIIHGTADPIVDYSYAVELADAYPSAEFITIEGGGHGFFGDDLLTALDATVEFIQTHIATGENASGEPSGAPSA